MAQAVAVVQNGTLGRIIKLPIDGRICNPPLQLNRWFYLYDRHESSCGANQSFVDYSTGFIGNNLRHQILGGADFFY